MKTPLAPIKILKKLDSLFLPKQSFLILLVNTYLSSIDQERSVS